MAREDFKKVQFKSWFHWINGILQGVGQRGILVAGTQSCVKLRQPAVTEARGGGSCGSCLPAIWVRIWSPSGALPIQGTGILFLRLWKALEDLMEKGMCHSSRFWTGAFKNIQFDLEDREPGIGGLAHAVPSLCASTKLLFIIKTLFWSRVHNKVIPDSSRFNNHSLLDPSVIYMCLLPLV